jgi:hypothetical protein
MRIGLMKNSLLILAASAALIGASSAQAAPPRGHGPAIVLPGPAVESVTPPPMESSLPPPVNPGTLSGPPEFGLPPVNAGTIMPLNQQTITDQPNFGALPGSPGSATYDPSAALPSLDNTGSALAPNPGTSAAGFGSPNTNTGTTPSLNSGG